MLGTGHKSGPIAPMARVFHGVPDQAIRGTTMPEFLAFWKRAFARMKVTFLKC
jgi:hypothetical protein